MTQSNRPDSPPGDSAPHDPYAALRIRNYRLYIVGWFLAMMGTRVQSTAIGWEVYQRTGEALSLGILGAVLAARLARTPILLDGYACTAAAAVLHALAPGALDHCLVAHVSAEPGHRRLLERLGKAPLFDLGLRLGEASGAVLAIPLLRAACACHAGMATFQEAGVSGPA